MLIDATDPSIAATEHKKNRRWSELPSWQKVAVVILVAVKVTIVVLRVGLWVQQHDTATGVPLRLDRQLAVPASTLPPGCPYAGAPFAACSTDPARQIAR